MHFSSIFEVQNILKILPNSKATALHFSPKFRDQKKFQNISKKQGYRLAFFTKICGSKNCQNVAKSKAIGLHFLPTFEDQKRFKTISKN